MHTLLLGNGLNRLSFTVDWIELLNRLAREVGVADHVHHMEQKPLSMLFEELCARHQGKSSRRTESLIKKKIATIVGELKFTDLHIQFTDLGAKWGHSPIPLHRCTVPSLNA